ncbi:MAG: hypothetical protein LPJ89_01415 [Hymenobacteraceae bacterium]|nr:hypothetical protein [Hymenobacteraceae bacterium]MDX5397099.1 hypothetical protein [Hymenobacteraceae bacterium]MDX5442421.1 hypothetical protein [Hymenobacteraceae bacterium]MDX5513177.1 hypothetical protein [Hymenobacteraceae bacterium]
MKSVYKDFLEVQYHQGQDLVISRLTREINHEEYQDGFLYVIDFIQEKNVKFWIINPAVLHIPDYKNLKWTAEEFGLRIAQSSLQQVAVINSENAFMEFAIVSVRKKLYQIFGKKTHIEHAPTVEAALNLFFPASKLNLFVSDNGSQQTAAAE